MAVAGSRDASWHAGVRDHRWLEVDGRLSNSFQISDGNPLHMRYYIYTSVDHLLFFMWRRIIRLSFWVCWEETVDRKLLCKRQTSCACSFKQGRRLVACCIMLQIPGFETVWQISRKMPVVDWIKRSLAALPVYSLLDWSINSSIEQPPGILMVHYFRPVFLRGCAEIIHRWCLGYLGAFECFLK